MAAQVEVIVEGLRSGEGNVAASLFADQEKAAFPRDGGKAAATRYVKLEGKEARLVFEDIEPGKYALSLMHDENGDGKMNMRLGIPLEGFGFSNNPTIYFGPPSYEKARFTVEGPSTVIRVRMKYLL